MFIFGAQIVYSYYKCTHDNTADASESRMSDNQSWPKGETVSIY